MPVYEYECEQCHKTTEAIRRMADASEPMKCEHCGGDKTHRVHSVFAATASEGKGQSAPSGACGRCGDPRGSCGM